MPHCLIASAFRKLSRASSGRVCARSRVRAFVCDRQRLLVHPHALKNKSRMNMFQVLNELIADFVQMPYSFRLAELDSEMGNGEGASQSTPGLTQKRRAIGEVSVSVLSLSPSLPLSLSLSFSSPLPLPLPPSNCPHCNWHADHVTSGRDGPTPNPYNP